MSSRIQLELEISIIGIGNSAYSTDTEKKSLQNFLYNGLKSSQTLMPLIWGMGETNLPNKRYLGLFCIRLFWIHVQWNYMFRFSTKSISFLVVQSTPFFPRVHMDNRKPSLLPDPSLLLPSPTTTIPFSTFQLSCGLGWCSHTLLWGHGSLCHSGLAASLWTVDSQLSLVALMKPVENSALQMSPAGLENWAVTRLSFCPNTSPNSDPHYRSVYVENT